MSVKNGVPLDLVGNPILVGSDVASMAKNYRSLVLAKVISIAPKSVLVEYNNTWNYGDSGRLETYRVSHDSLIVIYDIGNGGLK